MRKICFFIALCSVPLVGIVAQNVSSEGANKNFVASKYDRNSLTVLVLDNSDKYITEVKQAAGHLSVPEKYDFNPVNQTVITSESKREAIQSAINDMKVTNSVLSGWLNRSNNGEFDVKIIGERAMYNAKSEDMMKASTSKLGLEKIKQEGIGLIKNSHILVLDIRNVLTMKEVYDAQDEVRRAVAAKAGKEFVPVERTMNGWQGEVLSYLYKIKTTAVDTVINELWIDRFDANNASKSTKKELFDNSRFGVNFCLSGGKADAIGSQFNPGQLLAPKVQATKDELFVQLVNSAISNSLFEIETDYEAFRIKSPVFDVSPIRAKVGTKEGLFVDQRFFVMENIQNDNGETVSKRRGVVRVGKVANNSMIANKDSVILSKFYQTAGGSVETGMLLHQRNDKGLGVSFGYTVGGMGGLYVKGEENLATLARMIPGVPKNLLSIPQLKVFVSYGIDAATSVDKYDYTIARLQYGLSKGFYFGRNFSFALFASYGAETATDTENEEYQVSTVFVNTGSYLTMNLKHNVQLVGAVNYISLIGNSYDKDGADTGDTYDKDFKDRKGLSMELGLRIEF